MDINRVLVDIDPTTDKQPAFIKSIELAKCMSAHIELFSAAYNRGIVSHWFTNEEYVEKAKSEFMQAKQDWLNNYVHDVKDESVKVSAEVKWGSSVADAILAQAKTNQVDLIVKSTHRHPMLDHVLMTSTDWSLLRHTSIPILFAKEDTNDRYKNIMASVDLGHNDEESDGLNKAILSATSYFSKCYQAIQYVAHCYESVSHELMANLSVSEHGVGVPYESRKDYLANLKSHHVNLLQQILADFDIEQENQLVKGGNPHDLLPKLVEENSIDLLVVGVSPHFSFLGGTVERILDDLSCDVLVVV